MPPRRPLRVLHTADVHLDGDVGGTLEQQAAYRERGQRILQRISIGRWPTRSICCSSPVTSSTTIACRTPPSPLFGASSTGCASRWSSCPATPTRSTGGSIYDRHDFSAGAPHVHVIRQRDGETTRTSRSFQVSVWGRAMEEHVPDLSALGEHPAPRRPSLVPFPWVTASSTPSGSGRTARRRSSRRRFATRAGTTSLSATITLRTDVSQGRVAAHYPGAPLRGGWGALWRRAAHGLLRGRPHPRQPAAPRLRRPWLTTVRPRARRPASRLACGAPVCRAARPSSGNPRAVPPSAAPRRRS